MLTGTCTVWAHLTRTRSVVGSNPIEASVCFPDQYTLAAWLSTGWSQERI